MRLWHIDIIPYLPKTQLIAQWRELNNIFVHQPKHILINYIYNYPKEVLKDYAQTVIWEMQYRGYKIKSTKKFDDYFKGIKTDATNRFEEHDDYYLKICYYNLTEKFLRGQKDYTSSCWKKLNDAIKDKL